MLRDASVGMVQDVPFRQVFHDPVLVVFRSQVYRDGDPALAHIELQSPTQPPGEGPVPQILGGEAVIIPPDTLQARRRVEVAKPEESVHVGPHPIQGQRQLRPDPSEEDTVGSLEASLDTAPHPIKADSLGFITVDQEPQIPPEAHQPLRFQGDPTRELSPEAGIHEIGELTDGLGHQEADAHGRGSWPVKGGLGGYSCCEEQQTR